MASVSLRGIRKVYPGNVTAVHDFNLEIEDKEFIILVGPSGCGKSTTLRMIAGLEEITEGELFIGDKQVNDVPPKDRDIAMVFQNYALYPHMTVYKNMSFGLELRKTPKDEIKRRVNEAAQALEIEHLLNRRPKALSGGQRQRVALGRAMVRNPAVFLLDEPLSNLDAKLRTSMRAVLGKLHKRLGTTFIYVTHDQTEAMTMGDRIIVMEDGYIRQADTPQNLYDKPCNLFVAGFIGTPQMNFIDGVLEKSGEGRAVRVLDKSFALPAGRVSEKLAAATAGTPVVLGVRPEDIYDDADTVAASPASVISAAVELFEPMGSEVYLYLDCGGQKLTARVRPDTASRNGDTVTVALDMNNVHIFDKASGERL